MMRKYEIISAGMLVVLLSGFLMGCAETMHMGSFKPSTIATRNFENVVINDDYHYFIYGSDTYPLVIFGLKKNYVVDETLWKKITPRPEEISFLVSNMQGRVLDLFFDQPQGFDMMDSRGRKIGEWYAMLGLNVSLQTKEEGKAVIYVPSRTDEVKMYERGSSNR